MPIIIQFDVCRNNAASRDSVTRGHECGSKRPRGKKVGVKGFLIDRDFFDTISSRASLRIRALSRHPLSPVKLCKDARNGSLCILMIRIPLIVTFNIARI